MKKKLLILIFNFSFFILNSSFAQTMSGGTHHSLALCSDSTVRAWGANFLGQLGNGTSTGSNVPVPVSALSGVTAIAGGGQLCLALKNDGTVRAWGNNNSGQLGNGSTTGSNVPVQVSALSGVTVIAAGNSHSLALKNDGTVWAWGLNNYGQLGNGTNTDSNVPVQVSALSGITAIAGGWYHSLGLKNDGTVWSCGFNDSGQLGNGSNTDSNIPVQVSALSGITAIAGGGSSHSLALKNDGTVWAWGANAHGQLGNGTNTGSNVPVQVSVLSGITGIAAGNFHSLALKNDGTVWAWGNNINNVPVQMSTLSGIIAIAEGGEHSFALKNDGTVWSWGRNDYGQLGNGTNTGTNVPVQVTGLCPVFTGLVEENNNSTVNIFPNPATTAFTIYDVPFTISEIEMYNVMGEKIFSNPQISNSNQQTISIDVSDFSPGVYFVRLSNEKEQAVKKVVVQR